MMICRYAICCCALTFVEQSRNNGWNWHQLLAIFAVLQTANHIVNHMALFTTLVRDTSTSSFLKVIAQVSSTALFYVLLQLGGCQYGVLRKQLGRVEWRTLLGLCVFGTLTELVFQPAAVEDVIPACVLRSTVYGVIVGRTCWQVGQVIWFKRVAGERSQLYGRYVWYHAAMILVGLAIWTVQVGMVILMALGKEVKIMLLLGNQAILITCYLFWTTSTLFQLLK
jgi:hypothetical protein